MTATTVITVTGESGGGKGMTLDEIGRFVQECMRQGVHGSARPVARVRLGGQVKSLTLTGTLIPGDGS